MAPRSRRPPDVSARRSRRASVAIAIVVASFGLLACDGDDEGDSPTPSPAGPDDTSLPATTLLGSPALPLEPGTNISTPQNRPADEGTRAVTVAPTFGDADD
jgi:hypothetical protein